MAGSRAFLLSSHPEYARRESNASPQVGSCNEFGNAANSSAANSGAATCASRSQGFANDAALAAILEAWPRLSKAAPSMILQLWEPKK